MLFKSEIIITKLDMTLVCVCIHSHDFLPLWVKYILCGRSRDMNKVKAVYTNQETPVCVCLLVLICVSVFECVSLSVQIVYQCSFYMNIVDDRMIIIIIINDYSDDEDINNNSNVYRKNQYASA